MTRSNVGRWHGAALAFIMAFLVVSALAAPAFAADDNTLVIALPFDVPIPDVHKASGLPVLGMLAQIAEVLLVERDGEIIPWLAESWEFEDEGRTLIFKIRDNVTAHDGSPITADDVAWSINRFRQFSVGRSSLQVVTDVTAIEGNRVKVTTEEPFAPLLRTFTYPLIAVYSKTAWDAVGDDEAFSRKPVGAGPYKFVEWVPGDRLVFEAFDDHWAGRPNIDRIVLRVIADDAARVAALEAGEVDVIHAFSPLEAERLQANPNINFINPPSAGFIRLNMNTQKPPFDDIRVRHAVAHAIDRELISELLFNGMAPVARSLAPSEAWGYTDEYDVYDYNPQKARELLREAGVSNLSFSLSFGAGRYLMDRELTEIVQAMLADVGVNVRIQSMEWAHFSDFHRQEPATSTVQMALTWWRTVNADVDSALGVFTRQELPPAGNNVPVYDSEEFEALYLAQQRETDEARRLEVIREMQAVLMRDLPAIPMYNQPQFWATRTWVKGFEDVVSPLSAPRPMNFVRIEGK